MSEAVDQFNAWWDSRPTATQCAAVKPVMLQAWMASRAACVVQLPDSYETDVDGFWLLRQFEVKQAIKQAGLPV